METSSDTLAGISARRLSLKDRLKKRREAIGNILQQVNATASDVPQKRPRVEQEEKIEEKKTHSSSSDFNASSSSTLTSSSSLSSSPSKSCSSSSLEVQSLLGRQSARERESLRRESEILELLNRPTAKEQSLLKTFRSQKGASVKQFCSHATKKECLKVNPDQPCRKLHFVKIIQPHTEESLGDCSFLNTCFHMDTCKYVHYKVDMEHHEDKNNAGEESEQNQTLVSAVHLLGEGHRLVSPQWVQCDLRNFDLSVLGKFGVVMADPPWDIHMELPYGTMADDEMRRLPVPKLQDDGLLFLWVTGRAMELGRECLKLWGYERVDEIIWVKTNQLQRIIRTGRTGHWLNHGKEHCLVGLKGNIQLNRGLDCDVIVAEVRATSHKPDEIYGLIERLSPGSRKVELFGRPHNAQPNWITIGNQLDGVVLHDEAVLARWNKVYPKGYRLNKDILLKPRKHPDTVTEV